MDFHVWGWHPSWQSKLERLPQTPTWTARVVAHHGQISQVISRNGYQKAIKAGSLQGAVTVGDWVYGFQTEHAGIDDLLRIDGVLERQNLLQRAQAGKTSQSQLLAANLDQVWIASSMDQDFSVRRLERYLTIAWTSGTTPVILLSKADLCPNHETYLLEATAVAAGVDIHVISANTGYGVDALRDVLTVGKTCVLMGSSGVGKSTLVNCLLSNEQQHTQPVRSHDHRGQHTTTSRELIPIPGHGMLVDSPGIREVGLAVTFADVESAFPEIEDLSSRCRFRDCSHENEPGCAVNEAAQLGVVESDRVQAFHNLKAEARFYESRSNARLRQETKRKDKALAKDIRKMLKRKGYK